MQRLWRKDRAEWRFWCKQPEAGVFWNRWISLARSGIYSANSSNPHKASLSRNNKWPDITFKIKIIQIYYHRESLRLKTKRKTFRREERVENKICNRLVSLSSGLENDLLPQNKQPIAKEQ